MKKTLLVVLTAICLNTITTANTMPTDTIINGVEYITAEVPVYTETQHKEKVSKHIRNLTVIGFTSSSVAFIFGILAGKRVKW